MKNWIKRRFFYNFVPLGRKIWADHKRLNRHCAYCGGHNYSADPTRYISFSEIQWSIAHRINISEPEATVLDFLKFVPHQFYINNPTVSSR